MRSNHCDRCHQTHLMHYVLATNGAKHLVVECPKGRYHIKYVEGLDIPVRESKALVRMEISKRQMQLL